MESQINLAEFAKEKNRGAFRSRWAALNLIVPNLIRRRIAC